MADGRATPHRNPAPAAGYNPNSPKPNFFSSLLDDQFQLANNFGLALSTGQTVEHVLSFTNRVQQVSAEDVKAVAAKVLRIERSVTGTLQPEN